MKVKFHFFILILLIIFLFSGLIVEFALFLLTIFFHELGHLLVLKIFNQSPKQLNLTIVGGIMDVEIGKVSIIKEFLIDISGVCVNILLYFLIKSIPVFPYKKLLLNYNLLMIFFNILPIYPLDGYRILEALFRLINDPFKEQKILSKLSFISLLIAFIILIFYAKSISVVVLFAFLIYQNLLLQVKNTEIALKKYVKRYNYV